MFEDQPSYGNKGEMLIPVRNASGQLIGNQIRYPDGGRLFPPGKSATYCRPFITRYRQEGLTLVCEGPTDALAAMEIESLSDWSIVGMWSSSTIPQQEIWDNLFPLSYGRVVVAGDGDKAGQDFNQRVANLCGLVYVLNVPTGMDVRDLAENAPERLSVLLKRALLKEPLKAATKKVWDKKSQPVNHSDVICRMVEEAGGEFKSNLSGSNQKKYLCPFHDDRNDPSLTVDPTSGSWKCWAGCGQGGPVQFLVKWKGKSYNECLELMREYV